MKNEHTESGFRFRLPSENEVEGGSGPVVERLLHFTKYLHAVSFLLENHDIQYQAEDITETDYPVSGTGGPE